MVAAARRLLLAPNHETIVVGLPLRAPPAAPQASQPSSSSAMSSLLHTSVMSMEVPYSTDIMLSMAAPQASEPGASFAVLMHISIYIKLMCMQVHLHYKYRSACGCTAVERAQRQHFISNA